MRQIIQKGIEENKTQTEIAKAIGTLPACISREIRKYSQENEKYSAEWAHNHCTDNILRSAKYKVNSLSKLDQRISSLEMQMEIALEMLEKLIK